VLLALVFGVLLIVAVLISERARTTVLSTAVMFLVVGLVLGSDWVPGPTIHPSSATLATAAELALFTILFVDGAHLGCHEIADAWRLPGRALLFGLPLTIGAIAVAAHFLLGLDWLVALLLGAVLSPTDPVMVRTILEHEAVPVRLRRLLSVESGLNDGLALPPIIVLLALLGVSSAHPLITVAELVGGIAIGVVCGLAAALERVRWLAIAASYRPLLGVGIAFAVFSFCGLVNANNLLAAFAAGVTLATINGELAEAFEQIGEPISEAVKLATLLVFGATMSIDLSIGTFAFAFVTLLAARPIALALAFIGRNLPRKEWVAAAWFGPKGFASLLYAALVVASGIPQGTRLYHLVGLVVLMSIVAHSSTDTLVVRSFAREQEPDAT
jgi:NhaP-type Na+/H+ or K+/H+ antiporter